MSQTVTRQRKMRVGIAQSLKRHSKPSFWYKKIIILRFLCRNFIKTIDYIPGNKSGNVYTLVNTLKQVAFSNAW